MLANNTRKPVGTEKNAPKMIYPVKEKVQFGAKYIMSQPSA